MSKIKILSEKMAKLISAGEVVEKPASIVKELVENSIDAKATSISIEIFNGGQTQIIISDNGCGMNKDDLTLSILPHATSKIEFPEDLNSIYTLGFRGEALASICAVSEVSIMSKTKEEQFGHLVKIDDGKILSMEEISCETGTRIEVKNLFYNTPARLKFLRRPKADEADITDYIEKLMLAYSDVSFKYYIDGKLKYNTIGSGLLDNIYTIYGKEISDNCIKIDYKKDNYHLYGYIGRPLIAKPNRNYQTMLICGRYVKNPLVMSAVANAYENYLMKGKFPFYVLFLDMPVESLDVNIHPNKLEVKFEKSNLVYSLILEAISQSLLEISYEKSIEIYKPEEKQIFNQPIINDEFGISFKQNKTQEEIIISDIETNSHIEPTSSNESCNTIDIKTENQIEKVEVSKIITDLNQQNLIFDKMTLKQQDLIQQLQNKNSEEKNTAFVDYQKIGTIFQTYIILQQDEEVFLIDQHAAHERILFDKFINEIENSVIAKQDMIFPYTFELKDKDFLKIQELLPKLTSYGFDIYEFGENTFKIDCIPVIFQDINLKNFIELLLKENFYAEKNTDIIRDKIATLACRSAIKAGDKLTEQQIDYIVDKIQKGLLICPHGRPFVVKLNKNQIEKWFGRIV